MHNCDHGGVGSDLAATYIVEACSAGHFGAGLFKSQLHTAYHAFCGFMRTSGLAAEYGLPKKCTPGRLNRDREKDYPSLSTRFKAMHVKCVCVWVANVCLDHVNTPYERLVATCCLSFGRWFQLFDNAAILLTDGEVTEAQRLGKRYLASYQTLANMAIDRGRALYNIRPNIHAVDHMIRNLTKKEKPTVLQLLC